MADADQPTETVVSLVDAAIAAGGIDNISVVVIHVTGDTED